MKHLITTLFFLASFFTAGMSHAIFIGDNITATGAAVAPGAATIGAGAEFSFLGLGDISFDFDETSLTVTHDSPTHTGHSWGDFGYVTFADFDDTITGLSLASNSGFSGDILSGFSFTDHSLTLHLGVAAAADFAQMVFNINHVPSVSAPEPSVFALLGLGLVAVGFSRRKKSV